MLEKGNRANTLHGILLIALFSFAAFYIAEIPVVRRLSFSPLIVGIVLGMLYANSLRNRLPETWVPGIRFCTKQVLRWGIVLYGFRLTLAQVAAVGVPAVVVDLIVVTVTILGGVLLGRLLKIDRDTALMTSTGSAICGAAAVLGAEPVVKCEGYKTAIAVSTVVIFGTLSMFLYPVMYRTGMLNGMTDTEVAVYTGSTLHEVAHVAGAGNAMDPTDALGIAGTATITKMIRVMLLAPVLVIMGFVLAGRRKESGGETGKRRIAVPWFAFGFIGIIGLNSLLQSLCGVETVREIPLNGTIEYVDTFMLTMAMTALGTETSLDKFRQAGGQAFRAGRPALRLAGGGRLLRHEIRGRHVVAAALQSRQLRILVLGVAEHPFPNEVRETAGLFVCKGLGIAHQHQPVGMERPPERGVDVRVGIGDETQPLVEMLAADRDFILRRVDFQNDAPPLAKGREGF